MKYIGVKIVDSEPMTSGDAMDLGYRVGNGKTDISRKWEGYLTTYSDDYKSWCPKDAFEKANRPLVDMTYGMAIECLRLGMAIARKGWNGAGLFVFRQVPSLIPMEVVPNMTSLPQAVKEILIRNMTAPNYKNQMAIVNTATGEISSWVASSSDTFAEDYYVVE